MFLFLDYDETLTSHDSLSLIPCPSKDFSSYTRAYLSDLTAHQETYPYPFKEQRNSVRGQLRYLGSLDQVEARSVRRVQDGAVFTGWDPQEARQRARRGVKLRRGVLAGRRRRSCTRREEEEEPSLEGFLHSYSSSSSSSSSSHQQPTANVIAGVLSVSWSTTFLRASLDTLPLAFIHANDPLLDACTGLGTGELDKGRPEGGIRTGLDKLTLMRQEMGQRGEKGGVGGKGVAYSVYAGDSDTDLPCLLEASLGLILGQASSLLDTLHRIGFEGSILHGYHALVRWLDEGGAGKLQPVDRTRTQPWSESEEEVRAEHVCLVRVLDWVQGAKVLHLVLSIEEEARAQADTPQPK